MPLELLSGMVLLGIGKDSKFGNPKQLDRRLDSDE
jgi:hypothetical protein